MPKTATAIAIDHHKRATNLLELLDDCSKVNDDALHEAEVEIEDLEGEDPDPRVPKRYAATEWDGSSTWVNFYDTFEEAAEGAADSIMGEVAWAPGALMDLDTGRRWEPNVSVKWEPLRWGLRTRTKRSYGEPTEATMAFVTKRQAQDYKRAVRGSDVIEVLSGPIDLFA